MILHQCSRQQSRFKFKVLYILDQGFLRYDCQKIPVYWLGQKYELYCKYIRN